MSDRAHRRLQYTLIIVGLLAFGSFAGWAANRLDALTVYGDIEATGKIVSGTTAMVGSDLTVVGDGIVGDDFDIAGDFDLVGDAEMDSLYAGNNIAVATGKYIRTKQLLLVPYTGAFPAKNTLAVGTLVYRADTLYILNAAKSTWVPLN
jgi:hypothetical protein